MYFMHYVIFLGSIVFMYFLTDLWKAIETDVLQNVGFRPVANLQCQPEVVAWFKSFMWMCACFILITFYLSMMAN